jgi:hypothetical protein
MSDVPSPRVPPTSPTVALNVPLLLGPVVMAWAGLRIVLVWAFVGLPSVMIGRFRVSLLANGSSGS